MNRIKKGALLPNSHLILSSCDPVTLRGQDLAEPVHLNTAMASREHKATVHIQGVSVHRCKLENTNSCSDVTPQRSNGLQYQRG
jgi:hypothetical protein